MHSLYLYNMAHSNSISKGWVVILHENNEQKLGNYAFIIAAPAVYIYASPFQ